MGYVSPLFLWSTIPRFERVPQARFLMVPGYPREGADGARAELDARRGGILPCECHVRANGMFIGDVNGEYLMISHIRNLVHVGMG